MAKAKKTTPATDSPAAPAPKRSAVKAKKATPAVVTAPMVDTTLAAQAAAKQLVAGLTPPPAVPASGKESASFKQLKQSLANPTGGGLEGVLDKSALPGSRKSNVPFAGPKSAGGGGGGRNQTFGADVNRSGVPRRTSGG